MQVLVGALSLLAVAAVLRDAFETVVLPRRVARHVRIATAFYTPLWRVWAGRRISLRRREDYLSYYGPLALILLLLSWAVALVAAFAGVQWALGTGLSDPTGGHSYWTDLYMSGTTFFTLGLGDVAPYTTGARFVAVLEAGVGFGFLALVIGYLPVLYQSFSRREAAITLLDARAGSPPSAVELLRRTCRDCSAEEMDHLLGEWEHWCADLLESHLSYPILAFYRSQHDSQSWLAAVTTMLDLCALCMVGVNDLPRHQAQFTFALARHAVIDLSQVLRVAPRASDGERLPPADLARLYDVLAESGLTLRSGPAAERQFAELRHLYEPYVQALARVLLMPLPTWLPSTQRLDDWQTSAWEESTALLVE